jgi:hypothetical protein
MLFKARKCLLLNSFKKGYLCNQRNYHIGRAATQRMIGIVKASNYLYKVLFNLSGL